MSKHGSPRKYPRMARVNEVVREVVADELERLSDPRLGLVTVTGVDVSADLRHASVYYSSLEERARRGGGVPVPMTTDDTRAATRDALRSAAPKIQAALARQVRLKYVPELVFHEDPSIAQGERIEELIRRLHAGDGPPT
ncbi:MAG: 30S ribosome-binding factor RbfA [Acidimicrobiia bacterium]